MFDKVVNLKWYFQFVLLAAVGSIVYLAVWYFVTSGTREEVAQLQDQVSQLKTKNEAARVATQRINEFRALFASKSAEYDELKVLLPEQREITNVLQGLQDTANSSRLIVMRFTPREDVTQDTVSAKPVEVEVDANFNNLRAFFDAMAKMPRIVSITDFKLNQTDKQSDQRTLHAQFLLSAYYAAPQDASKAAAPGAPGAAPGAAPAPAAPAPAAPAP
ncbi:MAG: type 4a pilus biogenesis protein PilO, partial [Pyrinomonadaceae bacterium]